MSREVRASHPEPGGIRPGGEEEGSLHGPDQDDDVAPARLDLLGRRHESPLPPSAAALQNRSAAESGGDWLRSCRSSHRIMSSPPPYPPSVPSEAITRWPGTTSAIGFRPVAAPTPRVADRCPAAPASSPSGP